MSLYFCSSEVIRISLITKIRTRIYFRKVLGETFKYLCRHCFQNETTRNHLFLQGTRFN